MCLVEGPGQTRPRHMMIDNISKDLYMCLLCVRAGKVNKTYNVMRYHH